MEEMKNFNWPVEAEFCPIVNPVDIHHSSASDSRNLSNGGRKRKTISSGKCKVEEESSVKRFRSEEESLSEEKSSKELRPKQDFIHVRARRGQATDSHSLAERVRREKISQRMKFLQDLVPGCNKVTGKAVMLDEIINYVQSLQRQVEFLSMKLATVNPHLDLNIESLLSKEIDQVTSSLPEPRYPFDFRAAAFPFSPPPPPPLQPLSLHSIPNVAIDNGLHGQFSLGPTECFPHEHSQLGSLWDEDLHTFGHAAFDQGTEAFHALLPSDQMKIEL